MVELYVVVFTECNYLQLTIFIQSCYSRGMFYQYMFSRKKLLQIFYCLRHLYSIFFLFVFRRCIIIPQMLLSKSITFLITIVLVPKGKQCQRKNVEHQEIKCGRRSRDSFPTFSIFSALSYFAWVVRVRACVSVRKSVCLWACAHCIGWKEVLKYESAFNCFVLLLFLKFLL